MPSYPYYTEPTHDRGIVTNASGNASRDTGVSDAEGRLVIDVVDRIFLLEPTKHPLITLLTNVGKTFNGDAWSGSGLLKSSCHNPEFKWIEDHYGGRYCKNVGTYSASGGLTITVTGAGSSPAYIFTAGDVFKNIRTGEHMLVATVASTTTITVATASRAYGTTAASAGADGDEFLIIGNVNEENASARNVNTTRSATNSNYTQIFRTSIAVSGTEKAARLYGGSDLTYLRRKKATQHALDIERAFWFGEKKNDTGGTQGHQRRATGGILEWIDSGNSYVQDQGGPLTAPDFNTFLREAFTYNAGGTKTLFCGGKVLQAINEFARGQIQTKVGETTYGLSISKYVSAFGNVNLVHVPQEVFPGEYAGSAFLLDVSNCLKYRFMDGRDTMLRSNVQAPDVDGQVDEYLTEAGLERKLAPTCAMLKGVID